ncbi:hypothetical protein B0T21DRAFT_384829 [Apiosordaria backusii]|uniref:Uncharacterized protein n=1 Tax=Apiosordaria backusii TaxID=314023 RepID=A0AA40BE52_9PEZI|nr:hypothetical protein B0T21DRAFT_384829 [Apiosordaria backusii]
MVNTTDIHEFLRNLGPSNAHAGAYDQAPNPYHPGIDTPRYAGPITSGDLPDGSESEYPYSDTQSYTTTPTVASRSTMQSSTSSVFSNQTRWGYQSSVGHTSIASGRHTFAGQHAAPPVAAPASHHAGDLWCEFSELKNCSVTFRLDDEASWIEHHVRHLRDKLPVQSNCWFCDDFRFVAESPGELYPRFYDRMQHIYSHIYDDRMTSHDVRPDFHVVEHMYRQRLIPDQTYRIAMQFDELPPEYRIPGVPGAAPPSSSSSSSRSPAGSWSHYRSDHREGRSQGSQHRSGW